MKRIHEGELYEHLSGFLKAKGVELKDGSYAGRIRQGCELLTEAINVGQRGLTKAKTKAEAKLDQLRQAIHEKTAPKSKAAPTAAPAPSSAPPADRSVPPVKAKSAPRKRALRTRRRSTRTR